MGENDQGLTKSGFVVVRRPEVSRGGLPTVGCGTLSWQRPPANCCRNGGQWRGLGASGGFGGYIGVACRRREGRKGSSTRTPQWRARWTGRGAQTAAGFRPCYSGEMKKVTGNLLCSQGQPGGPGLLWRSDSAMPSGRAPRGGRLGASRAPIGGLDCTTGGLHRALMLHERGGMRGLGLKPLCQLLEPSPGSDLPRLAWRLAVSGIAGRVATDAAALAVVLVATNTVR